MSQGIFWKTFPINILLWSDENNVPSNAVCVRPTLSVSARCCPHHTYARAAVFLPLFIKIYWKRKKVSKILPGKVFQKIPWVMPRIFEILILPPNFVFWKSFPEIPLSHAPNFEKWPLEKFSGKSPESCPGFFDPVNFEHQYFDLIAEEVYSDITSRCTNPVLIDGTWPYSIIIHGDVTIQQKLFLEKFSEKSPDSCPGYVPIRVKVNLVS